MNPLLHFCPYCHAQPGESCRQTMLDKRPVTEPHRLRTEYAQEAN